MMIIILLTLYVVLIIEVKIPFGKIHVTTVLSLSILVMSDSQMGVPIETSE